MWWNGPEFLKSNSDYFNVDQTLMELKNVNKVVLTVIPKNTFGLVLKFDSFINLRLVTAYIQQFIHNCKQTGQFAAT